MEIILEEGFKIHRDRRNKIVAIEDGCLIAWVGQRVVSKGRFEVDRGIPGQIVEIRMPKEGGHTSDILMVLFEGRSHPLAMKFKDLF